MTDIATLGIRIDSSQATAAVGALQALAGAAKPAEVAAAGLGKAAAVAATSHAGLSTQAMAAGHATRSMIESLVMGVPVTQVLGQQISHLSFAASGPGGLAGAFKEVGGSLLRMISPTTAVIGGLAAVGAGALYSIRSLAETGKAFEDTAAQANTTTAALHSLATAAAFKGISTPDFLKAMDRFAASVFDAKNDMGGLAEMFRANGATAKDFNGYLSRTADLIKNAANDQARLQLLQQAGLPATMQWVRFLQQGSAGLKAAQQAASDFAASAEGKLVAAARKFDEQWNTAWTNFGNNSKSAILRAVEYMDSLQGSADRVAKKIGNSSFWDNFIPKNFKPEDYGMQSITGNDLAKGRVSRGFEDVNTGYTNTDLQRALQQRANAADPTALSNALQRAISREQPILGLLGQAVPASQDKKDDGSDSRKAA